MIYKEYSKEFLTIITKEKPDFLLLDFDPDIKFGIKKLAIRISYLIIQIMRIFTLQMV